MRIFDKIRQAFGAKPSAPTKPNILPAHVFDEVLQSVHGKMSGQHIDLSRGYDYIQPDCKDDDGLSQTIKAVDELRGDQAASSLHQFIRWQYIELFGALNNVRETLDRELIDALSTLGVNFHAVNETSRTPESIMRKIVENPSTSAEARRQAEVDLAYLIAVIVGETLTDEGVE